MYSAPWTDIGRLQQDLDVIKSEIHRKANSYELSEINRKVDSLEHSLQQLGTEIDSLRQRMYELEAREVRSIET